MCTGAKYDFVSTSYGAAVHLSASTLTILHGQGRCDTNNRARGPVSTLHKTHVPVHLEGCAKHQRAPFKNTLGSKGNTQIVTVLYRVLISSALLYCLCSTRILENDTT